MTLRAKLALALAAGVAAGTFSATAPASAYCIHVDGVGCVNPCDEASRAYTTVTGKPSGFNCPK